MATATSPAEVRTIADLVTSRLHVEATAPVSRAAQLWDQHPGVDGMAVLAEGQVRFLSRPRFFLQLGKRFGYSLFENRPVALLSEEGSTVSAEMDPIEVISIATQREPERIYDDILVVDERGFHGLVSMRSLLTHHKGLLVTGMAERVMLEEKSRRLEGLNRDQARFIAALTRELRAPVDAILGMARALQRDPDTAQRHDRGLLALLARAQEALTIVNDLEDLNQLELADLRPVLEPVELEPLLEDVMAEARTLSAGKPVRLHREEPGPAVRFPTDAVFVRRILANLLAEAVARTSEGTVELAAIAEPGGLTLTVGHAGPALAVSPAEPFNSAAAGWASRAAHHGDRTSRRLATVLRLVDLLDGTLDAQAQGPEGACVTVQLPRPRP